MVERRTPQDRRNRRSAYLSFARRRVNVGTPTWIWSVVVDGELYVRAYKGRVPAGTKPPCGRRRRQITAGGVTRDVSFTPVEGAVTDRIDDVYRSKYGRSSYLASMISARARAATVRIAPLPNH